MTRTKAFPLPFILASCTFGLAGMPGIEPALPAPITSYDESPIFERLSGDWAGEGTLLGRAARFTIRWQLADGFAVLTFSNAFVDTAGNVAPVLNAVAVYRTSLANPEAVWLDSRGARIEIRWEATDSALVAHWTAANERGRTTYHVRSHEALDVVDEVLSGESYRTFATARLTRVRSNALPAPDRDDPRRDR